MTTTTTSINETQAYEALRAAQLNEHKGAMSSSARLCAAEAETAFNLGIFDRAHARALKSLAYSVGVFHADHARVKAMVSP